MSLQEALRARPDLSTISTVREELGCTLRALRFYEQKELVTPQRHGKHRLYAPRDIERLRRILKLKSLGLSLAEIKQTVRKPAAGPYGLSRKLCEKLIHRITVSRSSADAALKQLRQIVLQFPVEE